MQRVRLEKSQSRSPGVSSARIDGRGPNDASKLVATGDIVSEDRAFRQQVVLPVEGLGGGAVQTFVDHIAQVDTDREVVQPPFVSAPAPPSAAHRAPSRPPVEASNSDLHELIKEMMRHDNGKRILY